MDDTTNPKWARVSLPVWMAGGRPEQLLEDAGYVVRSDAAHQDELRISTREAYYGRKAAFVAAESVEFDADGVSSRSAHRVARLLHPTVDSGITAANRALAEAELRNSLPNPIVDWAHQATVRIAIAQGQAELEAALANAVDALGLIRLEDDGTPVFADSQVWVLTRAESLTVRLATMKWLVAFSADARLAGGDVERLVGASRDRRSIFGSSEMLIDGTTFLSPYLNALLGALSPGVWAVLAPRINGSILFSLGRVVPGMSGVPTTMLDTIRKDAVVDPHTPSPFPDQEHVAVAISWWVDALNSLFEWLTDPAVFADRDGGYQPLTHMQAVASVEQAFRQVVSIQTLHRDSTARAALMFGVVDTLESLTGQNSKVRYSLGHAEKVLSSLEATLGSAGDLLLPAARRGVDALRLTADGFYLRDDEGLVPLVTGKPAREPAAAVQEYLTMRRNATHGYGSNRADRRQIDANLMSRHTGRLPHDLPLLAWLYVLDFLASPGRGRSIARRSATSAWN